MLGLARDIDGSEQATTAPLPVIFATLTELPIGCGTNGSPRRSSAELIGINISRASARR